MRRVMASLVGPTTLFGVKDIERCAICLCVGLPIVPLCTVTEQRRRKLSAVGGGGQVCPQPWYWGGGAKYTLATPTFSLGGPWPPPPTPTLSYATAGNNSSCKRQKQFDFKFTLYLIADSGRLRRQWRQSHCERCLGCMCNWIALQLNCNIDWMTWMVWTHDYAAWKDFIV